ncbi:MAG: hypothetical protein ACRDA4_05135 [Filifactoraceae bacterium]
MKIVIISSIKETLNPLDLARIRELNRIKKIPVILASCGNIKAILARDIAKG